MRKSNVHMASPPGGISTVLFALLSLTICLVALPLASNRPVFWFFWGIVAGVSLLVWSFAVYRGAVTYQVPLKKVWFIVAPFLLVILWVLVQLLPIGAQPLWQITSAMLGEQVYPSITLDRYKTYDALIRLLTYGCFFWLGLQVGRSSRFAGKLLQVFVIASGMYALYGLVAYVWFPGTLLWFEKEYYPWSLTSSFVNRNSYATYAGFGMIAALAAMFHKATTGVGHLRGKQFYAAFITNLVTKANIYVCVVVVLAIALILTNSRAGIVSTLIAIAGFFLLSAVPRSMQKFRPVYTVCTVMFLSILAALFMVKGQDVASRFSYLHDHIGARQGLYQVTVRAINDNAITGTGLGTFEHVFPLYRDQSYALVHKGKVDHAHNTYLELALELGIPATLVLLLSYIGMVFLCCRGVLTRKQGQVYPAVALAFTLLVGVHALVDFSIEMPAVAITYAIFMGVGCAQSWSKKQQLAGGIGG